MPKVNCNFCGTELIREPNRIQNSKHQYCDRKCLANSKKNTQEVKCSWCDKGLMRFGGQIKKNTTGKFFCGFDCRSSFYKEDYKVTCVVCDSEFEKNPAEQKRYPVHCCSVKCRSKYNDRREARKCKQCDGDVFRPPSILKGRKNIFCSQDCFDIFQDQKTEVKCEKCGKKVWKSPSAMKERHYFCSRQCFSRYAFSESFVETEFEKLIKPLGIPYYRNNRSVLHGCAKNGGGLELDFYFPTIKFAVEVNGACHYKPIYGQNTLVQVKFRDRNKRRACKRRGIILRVVKPGNCKRETYLPRYKRVVWEINRRTKNANRLKN